MVRKSYGKMRGTKKKLCKREVRITQFLDEFSIGDNVHVVLSSHKTPHPKFHGATGKIVGKSGKAYIVEVRNKKALKRIYLGPEHLRR